MISALPDILTRVGEVVALCVRTEVEISIIDLDVQPEPIEARFVTLYTADAAV